ncbi:hypothetical protein, partial [Microcoleus sp. LEGE 07076]|uniref:hypothetical protein n=1 Tax=Microcoleus sp. LEGE 07076 TaxID=915322 RepID=UPI001D147EC4
YLAGASLDVFSEFVSTINYIGFMLLFEIFPILLNGVSKENVKIGLFLKKSFGYFNILLK